MQTSGGRAVLRLGMLVATTGLLAACERAPEGPPPGPIPTAYSIEPPDEPVPLPIPASREKCYGIGPAQHNGGGAKGPGTARLDKQRDAWVFVPRGKCGDYGGSLVSRRDPRL